MVKRQSMRAKRLSSLNVFDGRKAKDKWHRSITDHGRGVLPGEVPFQDHIYFQWAFLRGATDELLGKQRRSEGATDGFLVELIHSHERKTEALAACSHRLSSTALVEVLDTFNSQDDANGGYLRAFVAAAHGNIRTFAIEDEAWAITLHSAIQLSKDKTKDHSTANFILGKWRTSTPPQNAALRTIARRLTTPICRDLSTELSRCRQELKWLDAIPLVGCLSQLHLQDQAVSALKDIMSWEIPEWRGWSAWKPDVERLRIWKAPQLASLSPLWALQGPDFHATNTPKFTLLARILANGQLSGWMRKHDLVPGPGLLKIKSRSIMAMRDTARFAEQLFSAVDAACQNRGGGDLLLDKLAHDDACGLDPKSLRLLDVWRDTVANKASKLLPAVLGDTKSPDKDPSSILAFGLLKLDDEQSADLREYLLPDIRRFVIQATTMALQEFSCDLEIGRDWRRSARSVILLRTTLASCPWLGDFSVLSIGTTETTGVSHDSLFSLYDLSHKRLSLSEAVRAYTTNLVTSTSNQQHGDVGVVQALHSIWINQNLQSHQTTALEIAELVTLGAEDKACCIRDVAKLAQKQADKLYSCMPVSNNTSRSRACHRVARIAARVVERSPASRPSWQKLVHEVMNDNWATVGSALFMEREFTESGFEKYRNWMRNLRQVFQDGLPSVVQAHEWTTRLSEHTRVIDILSKVSSSAAAIRCMLTSWGQPASDQVITILRSLDEQHDVERIELMLHVAVRLKTGSRPRKKELLSNLLEVSQAVKMLSTTSKEGFERCKKLVSLCKDHSQSTGAIQLRIWNHLSLANDQDNSELLKLLDLLATVFELPKTPDHALARVYFSDRVSAIMKQAVQLENMRMRLQRVNPTGVAATLSDLKIEGAEASVIELEMLALPDDLLNTVEPVDDNTIELHFPLGHLNHTQRIAGGVNTGESLTVRLTFAQDGGKESFCVHVVDPQADWQSQEHMPFHLASQFTAPNRLLCNGRDTRLGYALTRQIWAWIRAWPKDSITIVHLHNNIEKMLKAFGKNCVVCNQAHFQKPDLYRPTCCGKPGCKALWLCSALEIRLADLRLDDQVVELLLGAVHAASTTMAAGAIDSSINLLPDRPSRLDNNQKLNLLLDSIPALKSSFQTLDSVYSIRTSYSIRAELLLSWVCNSYRGFLISATGTLRIPNMPNVQQFVLADNAPEITAAFAQHDSLQPRQVLFHGTSMDRLYAILCQGLKVLSNTSFQTHGAVYGHGIYLATEPATAITYAKAVHRRASSFSLHHSQVVNKRVLLGIEYAGDEGNKASGIYVATDATKLLLRYIFLLPAQFKAPLANHVVPALQSNFHGLRSGARVRP